VVPATVKKTMGRFPMVNGDWPVKMGYDRPEHEGAGGQNRVTTMKIAAISQIKALAAVIVGVPLVAGGAGYLVKDKHGEPVIQSLFGQMVPGLEGTGPAGEVKTDEQVASLETTQEEAVTEPEIAVPAEPMAPSFSVLRVEPDGSVVIAGEAPANAKVEIIAAGEVMATTKAATNGDFAIVFDTPLSPGAHELGIRATLEDGKTILSDELGIVNVPGADGGEVLAMIQKDGEATRVLQKPEAPAAIEVAAVTPEPEAAAVETPEPVMASVAVQAVDVEADKVFVAGTGEPGTRVSVYVDNAYKGTTLVGPEGAFLFEFNEGLNVGQHDLRVDMLAPGSNEVASRAAVIIEHDGPEIEAPAPETVVASTEPVVPAQPVEIAEEETAEPAEPVVAETVEAEPAEPVTTAAVEPAPQVPVITTGRSVIIRSGDSLWKISRRMLGEGRKYTMIFNANTNQIKDPDRIYPGQVFDVPEENAGG